jgi:D-alanyl-D-alanine dipeptidase
VSPLCAAALLLAATPLYGPDRLPPVADAEDPLIDAAALVPGLFVRLAYASDKNITGKALYPKKARCWLRKSAAERLGRVQALLRKHRLALVAWDCARSTRAQRKLWKAHPHAGAVADPKRGSLHQRGVAVDLGLLALDGSAVPLPTGFDEFGPRALAKAPLPDAAAAKNRDLLEAAMHANGWRVNPKEWWHFSRLYGWRWPLARVPDQ